MCAEPTTLSRPAGDGTEVRRVYLAIMQFLPAVGGAERQVLAHARALRARGWESTIVTIRHQRNWPRREIMDGVPVLRVGGWIAANRESFPGPLRKLAYGLAVATLGFMLWWHRRRYDVLSVYQLNMLAAPAAVAALLGRRPMVICPRSSAPSAGRGQAVSRSEGGELADADALHRLGRPFAVATRALLRRAGAAMVVLSRQMRSEMLERELDLPLTVYIPNGVDTARFRPHAGPGDDNRDQTVICVSRLTHPKGVDILLHAWPRVQEAVPSSRLLIVGTGALERDLRQMAAGLGLTSAEFVGLQHDIPAYLRRASVSVLPSRFEGMPNALLEAMAAGLACVSTRVSGAEDLIVDGESGLLVEPEDSEGLAEALTRVLSDAHLRQRLGENARRVTDPAYSLDSITDRYLALYRELMDRSEHKCRRKRLLEA